MPHQALVRRLLLVHPQGLPQRRCGLAVVAAEEVVDEGLFILRRVPEQVCHQVDLQRDEVRDAGRFALAEHADRVVVAVAAEIRAEHLPVRMRGQRPHQVHRVVPDEQSRRRFGPSLQVLHQLAVFVAVNRLRRRTLDDTEPDQDVVPRANRLRRLAGVDVGVGRDQDLRKLLLHGLGNLVHTVQQRPHRRALCLVQGLAFRALAVSPPVVHGHYDHAQLRLLADRRQDVLGELRQHLVIGHAQLSSFAHPLAVDLAVPLRVVLEVLGGRQEGVEGVAPAQRHVAAAKTGGHRGPVPVVAQPRRELRLRPVLHRGVRVVVAPLAFLGHHAPTEHLAVQERGLVAGVQGADGQRRLTGDELLRVCPPAHPDHTLEELVNGVERPPPAPFGAGQHEVLAHRLQHNAVFTQGLLVQVEVRHHGLGRPGPDRDQRAASGGGGGAASEGRAGDFAQVLRQFSRRRLLGRCCVLGNSDRTSSLAPAGQARGGRGGNPRRRRDHEARGNDRQQAEARRSHAFHSFTNRNRSTQMDLTTFGSTPPVVPIHR